MFPRLFLLLTIFIPTYTLYLKTMPPTVFWQDSGIFLAGVKMLGVIYPPGFPLYILLGNLWVQILSLFGNLLPLNFAQQVHTFSGLWGAGAASLIGLSVFELISAPKQPHHYRITTESLSNHYLIPSISGLSAGFSYSLWAQSINAEVYSMIGFFAAIIFFLAAKIIQNYRHPPFEEKDFALQQKKYRKYLFLLALIWGLSFAVHPLIITFFPSLLLLFFNLRIFPFFKTKVSDVLGYQPLLSAKTWILALLIFLLSAFIPYLYLPIRSAAEPNVLWSKIDSPQAFLNHLTGRIYRESEEAIKAASLDKIETYPLLFFQEFFVIGLLLGLLGWIFLLKKKNPLAIFGIIYALALYGLISFYQRGTEYNFWLIPFYLYFTLLIGAGLWWITHLIKPVVLKTLLFALLTLGLWAPQLWINWPLLNRSNYTLAKEFGKNLIGKLPPNSIFFTLGDQESAIPMYLRLVENYRPDVLVLADSDLIYGWRRGRLSKFHPDLALPRFEKEADLTPEETVRVINEFIKANLPQRKIFTITKNYLPLEPPFHLVPAGTIWQVTSEENPEIDLAFWQYTFSDPNRYQKPERPEFSRKKTSFVDGQTVEAYQRAPYSDEAKVFELQAKKNLGDLCFGRFKENHQLPVKTSDSQREVWQGEKLLECAQNSYEEMFKIDPKFFHRDVFLNLAEIYKKVGKEIDAEGLIRKTEEKR